MDKVKKVIWGLLLVAAGVLLGLNSLGLTEFTLFFNGWWTLFLIVPCGVGLITERSKMGNLIGVAIGVFLLLCCQDVLDFDMVWKLIVPVGIVLIGGNMVWKALRGNRANAILGEMKAQGNPPRTGYAAFTGCDLKFDGEPFDGAELTAIFGGVECDLREAIIDRDCAVSATAIFGGVDIKVPPHVNVKVSSNSIFGGVSNKARFDKNNTVTLYVTGNCMFGGVDIK